MNGQATLQQTFGVLWRRAPLWRLIFLMSLLLTCSFVLFPPSEKSPADALSQVYSSTSYTQQFVKTEPPPQAAPAPAPQPAPTAPPTLSPVASAADTSQVARGANPYAVKNASAANFVHPPGGSPTSAPLPTSTMQAPQTASLSLATPSGNGGQANSTGFEDSQTGRLYSGSILANGYTIPLPEGKWMMLANGGANKSPTATVVAYYLGKIENKKFIAGAMIYAVKDTAGGVTTEVPLKVTPGCDRTDAVYMFKPYPDGDGHLPNCWFLARYFASNMHRWADTSIKMNNLVRAAAGNLAAKGVDYPMDLPSVSFLMMDKGGMVYASFYFNPEANGITSTVVPTFIDSDWSAANIGRYPEKMAYEAKLKNWGEAFWPYMNAAFVSGLPKEAQ